MASDNDRAALLRIRELADEARQLMDELGRLERQSLDTAEAVQDLNSKMQAKRDEMSALLDQLTKSDQQPVREFGQGASDILATQR